MNRSVFTIALCLIAISNFAQSNRVIGYVPTWVFSVDQRWELLTHINISFANPDATGDLEEGLTDQQFNDIVTNAHNNNVKVMISLAGANPSAYWGNLLEPANRAAFIQKIIAYATTYNLDGIDVDLEGDHIDANYNDFILDLHQAINGDFLLTSAMATWTGPRVSDQAMLAFDFINVMAYDHTGPWQPQNPGPHSTYDHAYTDMYYWINRGMPKDRVVLGVPFYGYDFNQNGLALTYSDIVNANVGAESVDQVGQTYYNGQPTIADKTVLGMTEAGGIMIWELSQDVTDSRSLLATIHDTKLSLEDPPVQSPYHGTPLDLFTQIEAEDYDLGGPDLAYNDVDVQNQGNAYRTDQVDIEATTDEGGGYNVGWIADGEWLEYTIQSDFDSDLAVNFRVASETGGGLIALSIDGQMMGTAAVDATGGWQVWERITLSNNVSITAGEHVIRILAETGSFNLNYFDFAIVLGQEQFYSSDIQIFPNPFQEALTIAGHQGEQMVLINQLGKIVFDTPIESQSQRIDLSTLAPGLYFATFNSRLSDPMVIVVKH